MNDDERDLYIHKLSDLDEHLDDIFKPLKEIVSTMKELEEFGHHVIPPSQL